MPQVTNPSAFTSRSLGKQVLFSIITLGFYGVYWFHLASKELSEGTDAGINTAGLGLLVPIYNLIIMWRICTAAEAVTDQSGAVLFIMFFLGITGPIGWYLIQTGMNSVATGTA
jgi:hypothetical protein